MSAKPHNFQRVFLTRLQSRFRSRSEMVHSLGKTLNVGRDAIYRRLRGDTALTADELMTIAGEYQVPVEERRREEVPALYYHAGVHTITSDESYFENIRAQTKHMVDLPNVWVNYATPELPIFYELATPLLRAFKIYVFGTTTWGLKKWRNTLFTPDLISPKTHALVDDILADTARIPGRELWTIGILDVTLRQISYMANLHRFAFEKHLHQLFDELETVVDHLEQMAGTGKRFPFGETPAAHSPDFYVYHNELSITNNAVLIRSDTKDFLFSTLINPNYVTTEDPRIIQAVDDWFQSLTSNANALNAAAGKYSQQYFSRLRRQVAATRERVNHANLIY